ncbi:FliI/YscN family ATPase [Roseovarius sp. LXJ103]|uniref:FliI/YscN family ATPase n=1 Tax=Roseovarius carneus TaxID=2853164 RepID=UPI000D61655A|nr:FliI/YscN family ATPase [Roseovarius carneus]MBZ8117532.1 FliI/YscN family ATPase [Roseovarius carneus]PWE37366.1 flagellum-specific ATP synthase FliI [Pelagicola sp. LXJ1103]
MTKLDSLGATIAQMRAVDVIGRVEVVTGGMLDLSGLAGDARLGDRVCITRGDGSVLHGEVLQMGQGRVRMLPDAEPQGVSLGDRAVLMGAADIAPSNDWVGRVIDPFGAPMDGQSLRRGPVARSLRADPPAPARRHPLGARLETGMSVFNTFLPIVRGQRIGLFAGSGVGKSSLLGHLGRRMEADVVVFAMIGERGRELRDFIDNVLGPEGMARSVIVAATSDRSPLVRRRCAWTAMAVAEHFRDQGLHVLFLADSITRFAEAHREVATAAGEMPALRGYPASTAHMIMSLCERAGPGEGSQGAITALFSVLVAGSDMEEPVADILRGVLDGHVVMDRAIAERGRYPAIDLLRSVSRSLPRAASDVENEALLRARALLGSYDRSATMIRAGLYAEGSDVELDQAIRVYPELDAFLAESEAASIQNSYDRLALILRRAGAGKPQISAPAQSAPGPNIGRSGGNGGGRALMPG